MSDTDTTTETLEAAEVEDTTPAVEETAAEVDPDDTAETFPRSVVEKLRAENARYRQRAKDADSLAERLHTELVRATGKLADPSDLPYNPEHLESPDALAAAVDTLLTAKPHLAARRPVGDIGQGATSSTAPVDLAAILRHQAG